MSEQLMDPALLDWIRRDEVDESEVEVEMDLEPMRTVRETVTRYESFGRTVRRVEFTVIRSHRGPREWDWLNDRHV